MFYAAASGSAKYVRRRLAAGAAPNQRDAYDRTLLMHAGSGAAAWALIEGGADVNAVDKDGHRDLLEIVLAEAGYGSLQKLEVAQFLWLDATLPGSLE